MRHLNQRSEMLSGISHDLRTPLTRMKLQLAFISDKELSKKISLDKFINLSLYDRKFGYYMKKNK